MIATTYKQHQDRIARFMQGQDDLYWRGLKVTPDFDMVVDGNRVRPRLQSVSIGNCTYTRVKRYGVTDGSTGETRWTPKMFISPLCGQCC